MYDQDGSGEITPDEMVEIFSLMYAVQVGYFSQQKITMRLMRRKMTTIESAQMYVTNTQGFTEGEGKAQAKKVFEALDMDKDGKIGKEEFITVRQKSMNI